MDANPMVVANCVAALTEIKNQSGKNVFQLTESSLKYINPLIHNFRDFQILPYWRRNLTENLGVDGCFCWFVN